MKLFHINLFLNLIIKKSDFDVYLFQVLIFDNNQSENRLIRHKLNYKDESLIVIQFFALFEVSYHSTSFITNNLIINVTFENINSFVTKYNTPFE